MKRILTASIAIVLLVCSGLAVVRADSQTTEPSTVGPFVFTAVDAIETVTSTSLVVKGVLDGTTGTTELLFAFHDAESMGLCQKQAMLAMDRPGRYALQLGYDLHISRFICRLIRH